MHLKIISFNLVIACHCFQLVLFATTMAPFSQPYRLLRDCLTYSKTNETVSKLWRCYWKCFLQISFLVTAPLFGRSMSLGVEWKRNLVAHGDAREEKWRGKRRMEWVAKQSSVWHGTVHPVLLQSFSPDPHSKKASTRLNWHPRRYKWIRPFRWKTESGFCACAVTFHFHSTSPRSYAPNNRYWPCHP